MEKILKNKVALVTGAASGIGKEIAKIYARHGAKVILSDIDKDGAKDVLKEIKSAGGKAIFYKTDVSKPKDCEKLVERAVKRYGGLHIACNNAGIGGQANAIADMPIDDWDKTIAVNLSGVFYGMKYQIPAILKNKNGGAIVNIASILGKVGFATSSAYVAAKHGVIGLTQNAALEYAAKGLRVNAVGPGFVETPLLDELEKAQLKQIKKMHPQGRLGKPEEIAELVLWLSSDKASFSNGGYFTADGGYLAK